MIDDLSQYNTLLGAFRHFRSRLFRFGLLSSPVPAHFTLGFPRRLHHLFFCLYDIFLRPLRHSVSHLAIGLA